MCLAIPVQIDSIIDEENAVASVGGILRDINTALVDDLQVGDYVILHVGYALSKLDEEQARETLRTMAEAGLLEEASS